MDEDNDIETRVRNDDVTADNPSPDVDDGEAQQSYYESSNDSETFSENSSQVDVVVREDMGKLENIFHDMGFKFRMIDRIGEGQL